MGNIGKTQVTTDKRISDAMEQFYYKTKRGTGPVPLLARSATQAAGYDDPCSQGSMDFMNDMRDFTKAMAQDESQPQKAQARLEIAADAFAAMIKKCGK